MRASLRAFYTQQERKGASNQRTLRLSRWQCFTQSSRTRRIEESRREKTPLRQCDTPSHCSIAFILGERYRQFRWDFRYSPSISHIDMLYLCPEPLSVLRLKVSKCWQLRLFVVLACNVSRFHDTEKVQVTAHSTIPPGGRHATYLLRQMHPTRQER